MPPYARYRIILIHITRSGRYSFFARQLVGTTDSQNTEHNNTRRISPYIRDRNRSQDILSFEARKVRRLHFNQGVMAVGITR